MRGFLVLAARILVSGALLYFALRGINFAGIQARLNEASMNWFAGWMAIAILVNLIQVALVRCAGGRFPAAVRRRSIWHRRFASL